LTVNADAARTQQQLNPFCLTSHQAINELISQTKLKPVTGQPTIHPDPVATILSLIDIAWSPGPLQKHNLPSAMQGKSQTSTAIGR
jgi:hypothetical protein